MDGAQPLECALFQASLSHSLLAALGRVETFK